jgi:hypothetical protein
LNRFFGGSGHSHPIYYYLPYLFSLGLPWSLFLPFLLWDSFLRGSTQDDDWLFFKVWFVVMFIFFSLSAGKRPVYLLPIYPSLALLSAMWFCDHADPAGGRLLLYRIVASLGVMIGTLLLVITVGVLWNHEPGWFFSPIARLLKPKDRANLELVQNALNSFSGAFTIVVLLASALWLWLGRSLWFGRLRMAAWLIVLNAIPFTFISRGVLVPVIAADKSYRDFMREVNQRVKTDNKLVVYGEFNSDPVLYYRGSPIDLDEQSVETAAAKINPGDSYIIMTEASWSALRKLNANLPMPVLRSVGKGPEGDAPLVLLQASIS